MRRARELGARVTLVSPDEARALVPHMVVDDVAQASYEAECGHADPSSTTNALASRARELGATIVQDADLPGEPGLRAPFGSGSI